MLLFVLSSKMSNSTNFSTQDDIDMDENGSFSDNFDLCDYLDDGSTDELGKYGGFDFDDGEGRNENNECDYAEDCQDVESTISFNSQRGHGHHDDMKSSNTETPPPFETVSTLLTPLTPMPFSSPNHSIHDSESESESVIDNSDAIENNEHTEDSKNAVPLKYTLEMKEEAENKTKDDEINFKYQYDLRVYVNRCMFIRNTKIGKRVGFAPSLPKTKDFVLCWNCNDWIPPNVSPPCIPLCSQTHMHSKYVFDKMFGYFCSWGCCKKYIYETMSAQNKSKYMRSLLQLRRIFYPDLANKPIETVEPRTCTTLYGGSKTPEAYYSSMVKINLPPLQEDISFTFNALKVT